MQPEITSEVKVENKIDQVQNNLPTEPQPQIKSEENQKNWAAFRAQREQERKAREESDRRAEQKAQEAEALRKALEAAVNRPYHNDSQNDGQNEESEEERIEKKVQAALKKERERYEKEAREREHREYPERLASNFSDFQQVCNAENLDYLEYHYPEVAAPYKHLPDSYEKWAGIYKAVKRFVPNPDSKKDMARAEKNLQKPGSISSAGTSQQEGARGSHILTEAKKLANWERMQRSLKGLS